MANEEKATGQGTTGTGATGEQGNAGAGAASGKETTASTATGAQGAEGQKAPTADGTKAGETGGKDGAQSAPKAPEKYSLTVPKGADTFIEQSDLDEFAALAKSNDWTQEEAQQRLDAQADAVAAKLDSFKLATEKDPEYGGSKLAENQRLARAVIDKVRPADHPRSAAFERLLIKTGLGNHPEFFAFMADLGRMTAEDRPNAGTGGAASKPANRSAEDVLYPADQAKG